MRFRKILAFVLAFAMMTQSSYVPVFAGGNPTISVASVNGEVGQTVDVNVEMENNPGVAEMKLVVAYDPRLILVDAVDAGLMPGAAHSGDYTNPYTLTWSADTDCSADGKLVTLKFRVSDAVSGGATYDVKVSKTEIVNAEKNEISFVCMNGAVSVACPHSAKTEVLDKGATCMEEGTVRHLVCDGCGKLFHPDGSEVASADDVTIPALGHDLGSSSCNEPAACRRTGCDYVSETPLGHDWSEKIEDAAHLKQQAEDCTESNEYWYDCSRCDAVSTEASFVGVTVGPHTFTERIEDAAHLVPGSGADCQHPLMYYFDCADCDAIGEESFSSDEMGEHVFFPGWKAKEGVHFHECSIEGCGAVADEAACSGGTATCAEFAVCSVCGNPYGEKEAHTFGTEWLRNQNGHWHVCKDCGETDGIAAHTPDREEPTEENPVVCTECGYVIRANSAKIVISAPETHILSGKSVQLTAKIDSADAAAGTIAWSLKAGDEAFASINGLGRVTAKAVYESHVITVYAKAKSGSAVGDETQITIHPYVAAIDIRNAGQSVTGSTVVVDVNSTNTVTFCAECLPAGNISGLSWATSDTKNSYGSFVDNQDGTCTISGLKLPKNKAAVLTLTAKATDGSKKTASVKLKLIGAAHDAVIVGDTSSAVNPRLLRGGASVSMVANLSSYGVVTDKAVTWSVSQPKDMAYASISASGKLTTVPVSNPVDISVTVRAKANPAASATAYIRLVPAAYETIITCEKAPIINGVISWDIGQAKPLQLKGTTLPAEAIHTGTWKSSSTAVATVDANGLVSFNKVGEVTITFTANDGSKKSASVKVRGGVPVSTLELSGENSLESGKKTTLKAKVNADASYKNLKWLSSDSSVASVSDKGVVTAKTVYEEKIITIYAIAQDGSGMVGHMDIVVAPKSNVLSIFHYGVAVNGRTIYAEITEDSFELRASELQEAAGVVWSSSNKSVATVAENGTVVFDKPGTVTITAKSRDGKKTGKVTIKVANLVKEVTVTTKSGETEATIGSGKGKVNLVAKISPADATLKTVSWVSENPNVAAVSSSGVVTAKAGIRKTTTVNIWAVPKDGSGNAGMFTVTVVPAADTVSVSSADALVAKDGIAVAASEALNNRTLTLDVEECAELKLGADVYPADAFQDVAWKSSNTSLAKVDPETGKVNILGTGAVTITATAQDGSGKSASVKLNLVRYVKKIQITNTLPLDVGSGCKQIVTYNLVTNSGLAPTGKSVVFSIRPQDAAYASISSSGVLTAKSVTAKHNVFVKVTSKDDPSVSSTVIVTVKPKVTSLDITFDGQVITGQTINTYVGNRGTFDTLITPASACQNVVWSANSNAVEVHQDGTIIAVKAGTATITAKAADGSGKTASIKVKIS